MMEEQPVCHNSLVKKDTIISTRSGNIEKLPNLMKIITSSLYKQQMLKQIPGGCDLSDLKKKNLLHCSHLFFKGENVCFMTLSASLKL